MSTESLIRHRLIGTNEIMRAFPSLRTTIVQRLARAGVVTVAELRARLAERPAALGLDADDLATVRRVVG